MLKKVFFTVFFVLLFCVISRADWEESGLQYTTPAVDISAAIDSLQRPMMFVADSTYRLYKSINADSGWAEIIHPKSYNPSCVLQISGTNKVRIGRLCHSSIANFISAILV